MSPELREELGLQDADDIVMVGKKPKKEKVERASDEVLAKAKKMTKTQRKRFESYQRRQENEKRQKEYIATLEKHSISDQERTLLVSGKDVGQTHTTKQLLQMTLKRYRAGLELSEEEHDLLFPKKDSDTQRIFEPAVKPESDTMNVDVSDSHPVIAQEQVALGLSIFGASSDTVSPSIAGAPSGAGPKEGQKQKQKQKQEKKQEQTKGSVGSQTSLKRERNEVEGTAYLPVASTTDSKSSLTTNLGASLLDQLASMKASGKLPQKEKIETTERSESDDSGAVEQGRNRNGH